jgi:hypothetical protein
MSLAALYPFIKPYALGAPDAVIDTEIIMAVKELARKTLNVRSHVWIDAQADWGTYVLEIPNDRHLEQITSVCVGDYDLKALESRPCTGCSADGYWVDDNKMLYLYPAPVFDQEEGIQVEYAYSPSLFTCNVNPEFLEKYAADIKAGVLSNVLMMKGQKWYEPNLANRYAQMWERAKISALTDGGSQYTRGNIKMVGGGSDNWGVF